MGSRARQLSQRRHGGERRAPTFVLVAVIAVLVCLPVPFGGNRDWIWPWFAAITWLVAAMWAVGIAAGRWHAGFVLRHSPTMIVLLLAGWAWTWCHALGLTRVIDADVPVDPDAAWLEAIKQGFYVTLALMVLGAVDSRRRLMALLLALFIGGAAQAAFADFMTLSGIEWHAFGPKVVNRGVATGTFVNRNHLAGYLALTGALGVGLLVAQLGQGASVDWRDRVRAWLQVLMGPRAWLRAGLVVIVLGLVLSQSRMGNLSFFLALAMAGALALWLMRPLPRNLFWLLVSLLIIDAVLLGSWLGVERVAERLRETTVAAATTGLASVDAERAEVARATFDLWTRHPHTGVGPGGFRVAFPEAKPESVQLFYDHAHNDWLELLAERGWPGLLGWLALMGYGLVSALRTLRRSVDPRLRGAAFGISAALMAVILHAVADFNGAIPAYAAATHALLAAAVVTRKLARTVPSNTPEAPGPVPDFAEISR